MGKKEENKEDFVLTGNESYNELLDYMVLKICREVSAKKAFKGGWMLTKLVRTLSRETKDVDLSIASAEAYEEVKCVLQSLAEDFRQAGIIDDYRLKEDITSTNSGGIDFYKEGNKILGVDIGLHEITWGVKRYNLSFVSLDGFELERMLADKMIAILSKKRFRRTKDLYDFYIMAQTFDFDLQKLRSYIDLRGGAEWENIPFQDVVLVEYRRAWDKLKVIRSADGSPMDKVEFAEVLKLFYNIALPVKAESFVCPYWNHNAGRLEYEKSSDL